MYRQLDMPLRRRARLPALAALDRVHDRGHPGGREGLLREARAELDGSLTAWASLVALRCRTADRMPGALRGVEMLAPLLGGRARRGAALHRQRRRAARDALRGGPARVARLPARGRRPGRRRARGRQRRPVLLAGRLLGRADDAARGAAATGPTRASSGSTPTATTTRPTPRQRLPGRHVPGRRLRRVGRRARPDPIAAERVVLAGVRDLDAGERELLERSARDRDRRQRGRDARGREERARRRAGVRPPRPRRARSGATSRRQFPAPGGLHRREALRPAGGGGRGLASSSASRSRPSRRPDDERARRRRPRPRCACSSRVLDRLARDRQSRK